MVLHVWDGSRPIPSVHLGPTGRSPPSISSLLDVSTFDAEITVFLLAKNTVAVVVVVVAVVVVVGSTSIFVCLILRISMVGQGKQGF